MDPPPSDADTFSHAARHDSQRPTSALSMETPIYEHRAGHSRIPRSNESEEGYTDVNSIVMVSKLSASSVDSLLTQLQQQHQAAQAGYPPA